MKTRQVTKPRTQAIAVVRSQIRLAARRRLVVSLLVVNVTSVVLCLIRLMGADNFRYWFLLWNLCLAWMAPVFAWLLVLCLRQGGRLHRWRALGLGALWLGFLPNSFYIISDLIHVQLTGEVSVYFDTVLFTSFVCNGCIAGFIGIMLIHRELLRRLSSWRVWLILSVIFVLVGYAVYLGRVLRWNTWDALVQLPALLFDISDTMVRPFAHPDAYVVTGSFALLIGVFYWFIWELLSVARSVDR